MIATFETFLDLEHRGKTENMESRGFFTLLIELVWAAMKAGPLAWTGPIEPDGERVNVSRS